MEPTIERGAAETSGDSVVLTRRSFIATAASGALVSAASAQTPAARRSRIDAIVPFRIAIPQADLDDLKARLSRTRWPEEETVPGWRQGVPLAKARALMTAWEKDYDWRTFERRVNQIPQFVTEIDGLDIHFLHVPLRPS